MTHVGHTRADVCSKLFDVLTQLRERRYLRATKGDARSARASDALRALCAGSITVEEYLANKLETAIKPLEALLRPQDLDVVRVAMSERITSEPMWRRVAEELRDALAREPATGHDDAH